MKREEPPPFIEERFRGDSGEMLESAFGGDNDGGTDDSGEDLGGFFDDMFGGGED